MNSVETIRSGQSKTRCFIPFSGPWKGIGVDAQMMEQLEQKTAECLLSDDFDIPFLQARPGINALKLQRQFTIELPEGRRIFLHAGAAMFELKVCCNGEEAGRHFGGYTPGQWDITDLLRDGENEITLYLLGEQAVMRDGALLAPVAVSSATLHGGPLETWKQQTGLDEPPMRVGVWQDIRLEICPETRIEHVKVTPNLNTGKLAVQADVTGCGAVRWEVQIDGAECCAEGELASGIEAVLDGTSLNPWTPDEPNLYFLTVRLYGESGMVDEQTVRFGWRQFEIRGGHFFLNGKPVQLRGESNLLQNRGLQFTNALSLESPKFWSVDACRIYLRTLKEQLDINSIRVHGSIGHPAIFEAADEVGLLVENQSSIWSRGYGGYTHDFDRFLQTAERELSKWVRRDWNHPCVIMWGAENEMMRIARTPEDARRFQPLEKIILDLDDSRPVCFDGSSGTIGKEAALYHLHHEENYEPFLRYWKEDKPLVFGEFWVGSRGAEQRLTSGEEYLSGEDYWNKQYRLWCQRIEPMRLRGVSGIFPYNFSGQWIKHWDGFVSEYSRVDAGTAPDGLYVDSRSSCPDALPEIDPERARKWKHLLGRHCICFAEPCRTFFEDSVVPAAVRNDSTDIVSGCVELVDQHGTLRASANVTVEPFTTVYLDLPLTFEAGESTFCLRWLDQDGQLLDEVQDRFYFAEPVGSVERQTVHLLQTVATQPYAAALQKLGLDVCRHDPQSLDWKAMHGGVLLADESGLCRAAGWLDFLKAEEVSLFIVEIISGGSVLPGIEVLHFKEPLRTAWKFKSFLGRELSLADMLLPVEGCWGTAAHPLVRGLLDPRWPARRDGEFIADAVLLHPGAEISDVMKIVHGVGAGMDESDGEEATGSGAPACANLKFRSLMTASRREYSVLAEVQLGGISCLFSTLRLDFQEDPRAAQLLLNAVQTLSGESAPPVDGRLKRVHVFHNWTADAHAPHPALKRGPVPPGVNLLSIDNRTVFAATQSAALLSADLPDALMQPEPDLAVCGGWVAMEVNECFEVSGPLFPWEFESRYPLVHGYTGLAFIENDILNVCLIENLADASVRPHLQHLLDQFDLCRRAGLPVDIF